VIFRSRPFISNALCCTE